MAMACERPKSCSSLLNPRKPAISQLLACCSLSYAPYDWHLQLYYQNWLPFDAGGNSLNVAKNLTYISLRRHVAVDA